MIAAVFGPPLIGDGAAAQERRTEPDSSAWERSTAIAPPPTLDAVAVRGPEPVIDGRVDEAVWERAALVTEFIQFQPEEGAPVSQPTEARILYGSDALFVGFHAYDSAPDSIVGQLTRRDQVSYSDLLYVMVDSYHDRRTAFAFAVNPAEVKTDYYMFDDTEEDVSWDAVWEVATTVTEDGWAAEFRIPYGQLRFDDAPVQRWGLNLGRTIARYDEVATWAPLSPRANAAVSRFGVLHGLEALESSQRLEIEPYVAARVERAHGAEADPFHEPTATAGTLGADAKYGITNYLTLDLTLNPDFGQIEADPGQVNLTAFETFHSERRPFFLEGQDIFRFGFGLGNAEGVEEGLFYSRRIGRSPQGTGAVPDGWVDSPENTTIIGASKVSGKTESGWSIGALHAVTDEERARVRLRDGQAMSVPVEPLTSYGVGRIRKDLRDGWSALGLIGTATNRQGEAADALRLHRAAYTGGVDARHRFGTNGHYEIRAKLLGSTVEGSADALVRTQRSPARYFQRPAARHVDEDSSRTGLTGWAGLLEAGKWGGDWRAALFLLARSPGFEANDLGFQNQADVRMTAVWLGYGRNAPGRRLRRWNLDVNAFTQRTFGNEQTLLGANVTGSVGFHNLWSAYGGVQRNHGAYSTELLRGGPAIRLEPSWNGWGGLATDGRRTIQLNIEATWDLTPATDSWRQRLGADLRWRPSERMRIRLGPSVEWNRNAVQWISNLETTEMHHLVGRIEQTTFGLTSRLELAVTPDVSLQLHAEPFASSGRYTDFVQVDDARAARYEDRFDRIDAVRADDRYMADLDGDGRLESFAVPDFQVLRFRSNAVLRWEYRPGSDLFLVWSQARDRRAGTVDPRPAAAFRDLFGLPPRNVLMLKASLWTSI